MNERMLNVLFIGVSQRGLRISHFHPYPGYAKRQVSLTRMTYWPRKIPLVLPTEGEVVNYPIRSWFKPFYPISAMRMAGRLHAKKPFDLIVTDDPMASGLIGYWFKRRTGLPLLIRCHTQYFGHKVWLFEKPYYPLFYLLARFLLTRADRVHAVSQGVADGLLTVGVHPSKIEVCHDPVRTFFFDTPGILRHPFRQRLLFVGNLVMSKGLDVLFRAMRLLTDAGQNPQLTIVGVGPERSSLERLADRLGIADRVIFKGFIPLNELAPSYRESDLFVLPSRYEGLGLVLVEAALCGLPVVATRIGGIPEAVIDGQTALLVPPDDPQALASGIAELFDDPERAKAMGEKGRRFARDRFNWDRIMDETVEIWRRTAQGTPSNGNAEM
jgi:glycosyltransferase involved in cell wall biosynthesis